MDEELRLTFESSLSIEEIENNFKNIDLFSGIMDSLQEILEQRDNFVN